jgi:hypothetical protein
MSRLLWARLIILEDSIVVDDTDEDRTDTDDHDPPPLKKHRGPEKATLQPVFKVPPGLGFYYNRALQDHENTASSNQSNKVGGSQGRTERGPLIQE